VKVSAQYLLRVCVLGAEYRNLLLLVLLLTQCTFLPWAVKHICRHVIDLTCLFKIVHCCPSPPPRSQAPSGRDAHL
jgi:hypothetical protein